MDLREIPADAFDRHPWETSRARFFLGCLEDAQLLARPANVIDVGAGDGFFASELARRLPAGSRVVCCDSNYTDAHLAGFAARTAAGGLPGNLAFVRSLPEDLRDDQRFDLLVLLDVLEHVPDDAGFLSRLVERQLRDGGKALISVPAWRALFTRHDLGVAHHRRYRPRELGRVITQAGLAIEASGGLFHSLLLPRAMQKVGERVRGIRSVPAPESAPAQADSDISEWRGPRAVTRAVGWALAVDNRLSALSARWRFPLPGLSAWALAQRVPAGQRG